MTGFLSRILGRQQQPAMADIAYADAMNESGDLLERMRAASASRDPVRAVMADIWQQRNNIPFMATIYEAAQEMQAPLRGYTEAKAPPEKKPK